MGRRSRRKSKKRKGSGKSIPNPASESKDETHESHETSEFDYFEGKEFRLGGNRKTRRKRRKGKYQRRKMGNTLNAFEEPDEETRKGVLNYNCSVDQIAENLKNGLYTRIVVLNGAGVSVSAGIPDFRTPGTGLYDNLQRFNLPTPESVFELNYFKKTKGEAFYKLAKEMWPSNFTPTAAHLFILLLHEKGYLQRCFTQNIDTLERSTGIPDSKIVEAHGSFATSSCTKCKTAFDQERAQEQILAGNIPVRCGQAGCGGLIKPDIVFFGEGLPQKFEICSRSDMPAADLLIVMGTSLTVHPFAGLVELVGPECPRLLINMKPVGLKVPSEESNGLRLRQTENYRDAMIEGTCDDGVRAMCDLLEWRDELEDLVEKFKSKAGSSRDRIDVERAFPRMVPGGLKYNWKVEPPAPPVDTIPPVFKPEDFDIGLIEEAAKTSPNKVALFGFEDYSKLKPGGVFAGLLCMYEEASAKHEPTHYVALVESKSDVKLSSESVHECTPLDQPMRRSASKVDVSYHQLSFDVPRGIGQFDLWYVNTCTGMVDHRWGPYKLKTPLPGEDNDSDQEDGVDDDDINEIIKSMGELPAHLQDDDSK